MEAAPGRAGEEDTEGQGSWQRGHTCPHSPQPPLSLWASVCGKLLNVEFELNMRDYIEKPDCE